jgi:two-component system response regulator AtoC
MPDLPEELPTHLPEAPLYVGHTPAMQRAARHILALAMTETTSGLILGESGTGKELVAGAIHQHSRRAARPFIPINCGAIPAKLAESELFGAEPGAFTGARLRRGLVEQAHTGTLFLDEIGELPLALQPTLLRFLQTRRFRRLGSERDRAADVRVLAATLRDLAGALQTGAFRADLFFRLDVITITLTILRARAASLGMASMADCDPATLALLAAYPWPGNLRELRNVLERALILSQGATITPDHLPDAICTPPAVLAPASMPSLAAQIAALDLPAEGVALLDLVHLLEDRLIAQALARTDANQTQTARLLGLTRDQLRQRLKRGPISPPFP